MYLIHCSLHELYKHLHKRLTISPLWVSRTKHTTQYVTVITLDLHYRLLCSEFLEEACNTVESQQNDNELELCMPIINKRTERSSNDCVPSLKAVKSTGIRLSREHQALT